ncbi:MAG: hypothetical protein AAFR61_32635 [Bacteroidota bacterium]
MRTISFILSLTLFLGFPFFASSQTSWYAFRWDGLEKMELGADGSIAMGKTYRVGSPLSKRQKRDWQVLKQEKAAHGHFFLIKESFGEESRRIYLKIITEKDQQRLRVNLLEGPQEQIPTEANFSSFLRRDTSSYAILTFYPEPKITQMRTLAQVKDATEDQWVNLLKANIRHLQRLKKFHDTNKAYLEHADLAFVNTNVRAEALLEQGFSPFFEGDNFIELLKKNAGKPRIKALIKEMELVFVE